MTREIKADLSDMLNRYSHYGWSKSAICRKWEVSLKTLRPKPPCRPFVKYGNRIALNAITDQEKTAVKAYALDHTALNHREMAYRMLDENVAFMSPSSVYRILKDNNLLAIRDRKDSEPSIWDPHQHPGAADAIWQTDLMIIRWRGKDYFLLSYIDVYSRFIPHHRLLTSMTGDTITDATQTYLTECHRLPKHIQSDNGSGYISLEYRSCLSKSDIKHHRIHPYCPNENAEIERYHRTLRDLIDVEDAQDFDQLNQLIKDQIDYYNYTRYHSAIGFITPYAKYTGKAEAIFKEREQKLTHARNLRKQQNLAKLRAKAA